MSKLKFYTKFSIIILILVLLSNFLLISVKANVVNEFEFGKDTFKFTNNAVTYKHLSFDESYAALKLAEWTKSFPDWTIQLLANFLLEFHKLQVGNCWGFSYTAKYYYDNPEIFESNYPEYSTLYEVPEEQISPEIIRNQWSSIFTDEVILYNCILFSAQLPVIEEQVQYILSQLDNNSPEILMLGNRSRGLAHAVLAYDYLITSSNKIEIKIYDNNDSENYKFLIFSISESGQYILEESDSVNDLTEKYEPTIISCATYAEPDWDFVLKNSGALIEGIVVFFQSLLPMEEIYEEIFMTAIIVISVFVALSVTAAIFLLILIRRANEK